MRRNKIGPQSLQEVLPLVDPGSRTLKQRQMVERYQSSLIPRSTTETVESVNTVRSSQANLSLLFPFHTPHSFIFTFSVQNFHHFLGEVT